MTEKLLPKPQTDLPAPEQPVVVKNETPEHHGKSPILKFLLLSVIVAIIFAAIGGAYVLGKNSVYKELNPTAPTIPPADPDVYEPTLTPDPTADWKTYSDNQFNLSFKYPPGYGNILVAPSPEGRLLRFTNNDNLALGAYIKPSPGQDGGRSGTVFDFSGYSESNGKYYFKDWISSLEEEIIPIKILNVDDKKILILNNNSFTMSKDAYDGYGKIGNKAMIALINLDNKKYSGIIFDNGIDGSTPISLSEFEKIITTFKFN